MLLVTVGLASCDQETARDTPAFQVRDSAGVMIYESSGARTR